MCVCMCVVCMKERGKMGIFHCVKLFGPCACIIFFKNLNNQNVLKDGASLNSGHSNRGAFF